MSSDTKPAQGTWHRRTGSDNGGAASIRTLSGSEPEDAGLYSAPTSHEGPGYEVEVPTVTCRRYAVIMVGLPARGKTFLSQKISRYLAWLGHESAVFNVQRMWRESLGVAVAPKGSTGSPGTSEYMLGMGSAQPTAESGDGSGNTPPTAGSATAKQQFIHADTFFQAFVANSKARPTSADLTDSTDKAPPSSNAGADEESPEATAYSAAVSHCVDRVKAFFGRGGLVAFLNDDFVTKASRDDVEARLQGVADSVLYIEVLRDDAINARFEELKVGNASEYGPEAGSRGAATDLAKRIALLKSVYERVGDDKSFIRIRNGSHIDLHDVRGYLPSRMTSFLMHLAPQNKAFCPIYFSRHGQSEYNLEDRLGGNPLLTDKGHDDAVALKNFIATIKEDNDRMLAQQEELRSAAAAPDAPGGPQNLPQMQKPLQIWTSQLTRTIQTARPAETELGIQCLRWRNLNEIHAGVCEHLTYAEVKEKYPLIHDFRKKNKYAFRYPDGESYQDLVARLEPVIMELENADRVVVVVAHQAVLRALLAYFGGSNAEHSVHVEVPHRTVWRCSYDASGIPTMDEMKLPPNPDPEAAKAAAAAWAKPT
uniref:6-phosphofructo-2-kinase domain-containing protein n=1 Tax=Neobodo designis TaxID=312471 RepID=A0A7S1Q0Q0_NEODS